MPHDLVLVRVLEQYQVDIKLPDTDSSLRERGMNKLRELGCTVFKPDARWFDMKGNADMVTLIGLVVEEVAKYNKAPTVHPDWT